MRMRVPLGSHLASTTLRLRRGWALPLGDDDGGGAEGGGLEAQNRCHKFFANAGNDGDSMKQQQQQKLQLHTLPLRLWCAAMCM